METIRNLPRQQASTYFDASSNASPQTTSSRGAAEDSPVSLLAPSSELEECEPESVSPHTDESPDVQWAPARTGQHMYREMLGFDNEDAPRREIKRDPQSVEVMRVGKRRPANPCESELHTALRSPDESLRSFSEDDDDDDVNNRALLAPLPRPRAVTPKISSLDNALSASSALSAPGALSASQSAQSVSSASQSARSAQSTSQSPEPILAQASAQPSPASVSRHNARMSVVSTHSPQHSRSSSNSGDFSPVLRPTRPRSSMGNRAANRLSYYDFSASTNNINLNLSDAVANLSPSSQAPNFLVPRMKTIELYKKNARKTNDPELEFQLAQYMMQTALIAAKEQESASEKDADLSKTVEKLFREAVGSLKRLSDRGFADAQYLLGDVYSSDALAKPDMERSFKYLAMAAKHGHAEASYRAALCLQEGWGCNRDAPRALQFFTKAAVRNQPGALYQLGMAYFYGGMGLSDTSANRLAGVKWLTRAVNVADQNFNRAPHELAKIYEVGFKDLVIPDDGYAIKLYAHSAELGFIPSAARLGTAYEFGELGCPQDPNLSIHYYTIAALGNDPRAQLAMCAWYMVGAGPTFPVNHDEAYEWALRAALNGLPKAQYTLGFFYENGTGTKRNIIEAAKWYRKAAEGGHEKALQKLQNLGLTDNDKQKGKCLIA